jgi:cyclase
VTASNILGVGLLTVAALVVPQHLWAQQAWVPDPRDVASSGEVHAIPVRDGVFMVIGPDANSTIQVGSDGVLVVDTLSAETAADLVTIVEALSEDPILFIINTHIHPDHTGGNEIAASSGQFVSTPGTRSAQTFLGDSSGASILAFEDVLLQMSSTSGQQAPVPSTLWPTNTYFTDRMDMFFNGEALEVLHQPAGHTDGDSIVFFRRTDVVSTGDLFTPDRYPVIDESGGGSINGLVDGLNLVLRLTVPELNQEGGTLVIPGHGRLCDESDVANYRDMVTIVRDRVQMMVDEGRSHDEVIAAGLTRDYDPLYSRPEHTGEMFVSAVFRSLSAAAGR